MPPPACLTRLLLALVVTGVGAVGCGGTSPVAPTSVEPSTDRTSIPVPLARSSGLDAVPHAQSAGSADRPASGSALQAVPAP